MTEVLNIVSFSENFSVLFRLRKPNPVWGAERSASFVDHLHMKQEVLLWERVSSNGKKLEPIYSLLTLAPPLEAIDGEHSSQKDSAHCTPRMVILLCINVIRLSLIVWRGR